MSIADKNTYTYNLLKQSLNASSLRSKIIANNLSNINTRDYKRLYVSFEDTLNNQEVDSNDSNDYGKITVKRDTATSVRNDGNNVDIDNEIVNSAANTLMYNALVNQVSSRLRMREFIIKGGK